MFLIRQSKPEDVGTLLKLARMVYFISLPPDERLIAAKIQHSRNCFMRLAGGQNGPGGKSHGRISGFATTEEDSDLFMLTIEGLDTEGVVGTCQVRAHMGGPGNPNYSFKVFRREFKSERLGIGTSHLIARLNGDESSPAEVGGLILQPSLRGHQSRPGRFLSFVRFHFMGMYRAIFADRVIAEMMGQVTSDGDNMFWDHVGRKFIPVRFGEADRFCQHNRKFIEELLPKDDLYLTLLPLEVLNHVGQVGRETAPARALLERIGFEYRNFIDPFDGGPHLEAMTDAIPLVRATRAGRLAGALSAGRATHRGIVSCLHGDGEFRALDTEFAADAKGKVRLPGAAIERLEADNGAVIGFTPLAAGGPVGKARARGGAKRARRRVKN